MLSFKKFRLPLSACLLAVTSALSLSAYAQVQTLKKILDQQTPAAAATSAPAEKPDETKVRLQQWLKEAREALARLEDPAAAGSQPAGITAADLEERRRDTEQTALNIGRYLKALDTAVTESKTVQAARDESAAWVGFKETTPYSIMMLDELRNEQDAMLGKLSSYESSMVVFQKTLSAVLGEAKANEEVINKLPVNGDDVARWRLDASRNKSRLLAVRAGVVQCNCEILGYQTTVAKTELSLLDRKIKAAKAGARFSKEDLDKIDAATADRKASLQKEAEAIARRQKTAALVRKQEQAALDALTAAAPEGKPPEGLEMAKFRADLADERVETLQTISEIFENLIQLETLTLDSYRDRKAFLDATSAAAKAKFLGSLNDLLDRLRAWEVFTTNEISGVTADLSKLDARSGSVAVDDPRLAPLAEQRKIKAEKLATYQRLAQSVAAELKLLERWTADFTPKKEEEGKLYQGASTLATKTWGMVKSVWSFEVTHTDEKFEVDGQVFTKKTPVTLGELLRALFFFTIAYWVLARIANKIQRGIVGRGHVADAQAKTLRNWAMIVVGVFLAIGTLSLLKIPITVFAFFGGALAIGLGFGSQTLIKNFICGIIVLFERKIRVGDIVDVGGLAGTVTEINTRSSVLRGGDGKETLIPNSYFLDNRITNLTLSNRRVRRTLKVGVAYGSKPQDVSAALKDCVERHGLVLKDPAPVVTLDDFGDTALVFLIYFWTEFNDKTNGDVVASDIRFMIEKRFAELEIKLAAAERDMLVRMGQPLQMEWINKPAE
jgi:small-conductance mechanosensitive channel